MRNAALFITTVLVIFCATTLHAATWYVDAGKADNTGAGTSWTTAKKDLQVAINAAASGDQVWVKAGTYKPTQVPNLGGFRDKAFFMKDGVAIYGGFAGTETALAQRSFTTNITTLSGDFNNNDATTFDKSDNAYHVVVSVSDGATTILDGFTIKGGNADVNNGIYVESQFIFSGVGGALHCTLSSLTIANCNFLQNNASSHGGAIYNASSNSTITNCSFSGNSTVNWGGAIYNGTNSSTIITRCIFSGNKASSEAGGAIYNSSSNSTITYCIFSGNSGFVWGGAIYNGGSSHTITNCVFTNNTAQNSGGAIYNSSSSSSISNCSFSQNDAQLSGGRSIYNNSSNPTITNCILWGNNNQISNNNSTPTVNYTIVLGGYTGTGNLNTDPLFVNAGDPDGADNIFRTADDGLRLQCSSPAIDAGTTTGAPATDILGAARVSNTDMGAYEYTGLNVISLATSGSISKTINPGLNVMGTCTQLICSITSNGMSPISGNTTAKVWVESTLPAQYVKRHYQITPDNNASTATGNITLYFTQAEFDDFNAVNTVKLPTGPADNAGKAGLKIEKRSGTSSDGTGLPNTYPAGTPTTIDPDDANIVWNSTLSRWEVSFDVTGFSGFFAKTISGALPVVFGDVTASIVNGQLLVRWKIVTENEAAKYIIEVSKDGNTFKPAGEVLTKITNGQSTDKLEYEFSMATNNMIGLMGVSLAVLLLLPFGMGRRNKLLNAIAIIVIFTLAIASCSKKDVPTNTTKDNKTLYVRIVQVDKAGNQQMSKVINATVK